MNFIRWLNRGNFYLLKFGDLLEELKLATNTKFQHNISKLHKLGEKTQGHEVRIPLYM